MIYFNKIALNYDSQEEENIKQKAKLAWASVVKNNFLKIAKDLKRLWRGNNSEEF